MFFILSGKLSLSDKKDVSFMNKTKNKKSRAYFVILLIVIISFIMVGLVGKDVMIDIKKSYSVIDETENSIEIACVGNSNLYSAFSPLDLWNEYGYTSTVCASARQTIEESYYIMEQHFETQKPKLVIIETDMLFDHNPNNKNFCEKSYYITDFLGRVNPAFLRQDIESVFSTLKSNKSTHGYRYSSKICKINYNDYMQKTEISEEISDTNKEQMDELINLCLENDAQILMVEIPTISSWNYERHNAASAFAEERNIEFLDFNLLYNEAGLDLTQCYRDKGSHLNYDGAKAITNYIGNYINNNYTITNLKSDAEYDYWDESYMKFFNYKLNSETSLFK